MSMRTERQGILDRHFGNIEMSVEVQGADDALDLDLLNQMHLQQLQVNSSTGMKGNGDQQSQDLSTTGLFLVAYGMQQGYGIDSPTFRSSPAVSGGDGRLTPLLSHNGDGNLFPPRILGIDTNLEVGRQVRVSKLFEFLDLDGNALNKLSIIDTNQDRKSGYWKFRGERLNAGQWYTFSAADISKLVFVSGLVVGLDKVNIRVQDTDGHTQRWSNAETVKIKTITPNSRPPVAKFDNFDGLASESYKLAGFISASDPDGFSIKRYRVKSNGSGTLLFKGKVVRKGSWVTFRTRDLNQLEYLSPNQSSGVRRATFSVQAFDGRYWSKVDTGRVVVDPNTRRPISSANDRSVARDEKLLGHTLFSSDDRDGNTIKKVSFFDTGVESQGGFFTVNGVVKAARTWFTVDWEDLQSVKYQASSIFDQEKFRVKVYDGKYWSTVKTGTVTTIEKPVIDVDGTTVIDELEEVKVSSLFSQSDAGPKLTQYEVIDLNVSPLSGTFALNGVSLQAGVVHRINASQLNDLTFMGGFIDDRSLDEIMIRAKNSEHWSDWSRGAVHTEPSMIAALNQLGTWNNTPGTPVEVTYSFLGRVPDYYAADAQERTAFERFNGLMRDAAREALRQWGQVSGISFVEVGDNSPGGVVRFGMADLGGDGILGWAYAPNGILTPFSLNGDIWINNASVLAGTADDPKTNQDFGSPGFGTFIHEIGHALGLSHPFDQDIRLPDATDSQRFTVMAYNRYPSGLEASAPQLYDVAASQFIYGENSKYNSGNTVYRFSPSEPIIETLWDAGGDDTLDFSNHVRNLSIDLRPGRFSSYGRETDNLNIAYGAEIENLRGGTGNDVLNGNHLANTIIGNVGDDEISGFGGNDVMVGGQGDDSYFVGIGDGHDTIKEQGGGGWDRLRVDLTGIDLGSRPGDEAFFENLAARRVNNDLHISLSPRGASGFGSIVIKSFGNESSRVETLQVYRGSLRVTRDVDLTSVYVQAGDEYSRFVISDFSTEYGQVALPK